MHNINRQFTNQWQSEQIHDNHKDYLIQNFQSTKLYSKLKKQNKNQITIGSSPIKQIKLLKKFQKLDLNYEGDMKQEKKSQLFKSIDNKYLTMDQFKTFSTPQATSYRIRNKTAKFQQFVDITKQFSQQKDKCIDLYFRPNTFKNYKKYDHDIRSFNEHQSNKFDDYLSKQKNEGSFTQRKINQFQKNADVKEIYSNLNIKLLQKYQKDNIKDNIFFGSI